MEILRKWKIENAVISKNVDFEFNFYRLSVNKKPRFLAGVSRIKI